LFGYLSGAELPGLDHAGMVEVWEEKKIVIWGGDLTWSRGGGILTKSNSIFELKVSKTRGKVALDVTKFGEPGKMAESRQNRPSTHQKGNIPIGKPFLRLPYFLIFI